MLRRLRLLFKPSEAADDSLTESLRTYNHFAQPHEEGKQITSVDEAFSRVEGLLGTLQDSESVGWAEKRLIRRSLPEFDKLKETHASLTEKAGQVDGDDRQAFAQSTADGFIFESLAHYTAQLSGVADYHNGKDPTRRLHATAEETNLLWQTLANSATSTRVAGMHRIGGLDHVVDQTGMPRQEAIDRLSEWPGTDVGGEWVSSEETAPRGKFHARRQPRPEADHSDTAEEERKKTAGFGASAPSGTAFDPARERIDAIRAYEHMTPNRGQLVDALRDDTRLAVEKELEAADTPERRARIKGAMKALDGLDKKDPITGGGMMIAERLVENGIVTSPEARKRLLGIAHLGERYLQRENSFIAQRTSQWQPETAPMADLSARAHKVHQGFIETAMEDASPQQRGALSAVSKYLDRTEAQNLGLEQSLKVTEKLKGIADPRDGKSYAALRVAEFAMTQASQGRSKARSEASLGM